MLATEDKKNILSPDPICIFSLHSFGALQYGYLHSMWFSFPYLSVWERVFYINYRTFLVPVYSNLSS